MARPRTLHVVRIKEALIARLQSGLAAPGRRFLSARAVALRFGVSYQTAHRLLGELEAEGLLSRKAASGTFVSGPRTRLRGVQLIFDSRAKRKASFGAQLLRLVELTLARRGVSILRTWADENRVPALCGDHYPVIWECPAAVAGAAAARRFAVLLNDAPPAGLAGGCIDAITTNDFSGGACAAELLKARTGRRSGFVVFGGPEGDARSRQRIAGFCSHASRSRIVSADSWFLENASAHAAEVLAGEPAGVFACNDRLAEAVILHAQRTGTTLAPLVGFDNAPVAERLQISTVGIPWETMVVEAADLAVARLAGSPAPARHVILPHEPIIRFTA